MEIHDLLTKFDFFLHERHLRFEAVAIGGAALNLLGVVSRYTRDCDILDPAIPESIALASIQFATEMRAQGNAIRDDWLNNGPATLAKDLPVAWKNRLVPAFRGKSIVLMTLGRSDFIKTKLFAFCDRGTDRSDCLFLNPSSAELDDAMEWVENQDANPQWPEHVRHSFADLAKELGHEL